MTITSFMQTPKLPLICMYIERVKIMTSRKEVLKRNCFSSTKSKNWIILFLAEDDTGMAKMHTAAENKLA